MIVMTDYKAIIAFSVFAMLALAGSVVFVAEDASADGEDSVAVKTITYVMDGESATRKLAEGATTFVAPAPAELSLSSEKAFEYWQSGSAKFVAGQEYLVSALTADSNGNATLTAVLDENIYITITVGEDSFKCIVKDSAISTESDAYKALIEALKNIDQTKFEIGKLVDKDGKEAGSVEISSDSTAVHVTDLTKSATLVLELTPIYKITFVNGDSTYGATTDSIKREVPAAPSKEHYNFLGWSTVNDSKEAIIALTEDSKIDAKVVFTEDTTLYAVFAPLTYKVFFMNGETVVAERSSEYMGQIDLPALPEGFVAWADKDGKVVGSPVTITGPDMRFYAVAEVLKCTVTFVAGDETVATVEVIKGEKLAENQIPALPEGYDKWDFNADDAIVENVVVKGALKVYDVTFDFGVMYAAMNVTIQVEHGQLIPADKVPVIPEAFPEKDKRWNFDASVPVTGPMTIQLRDNIYYDVAFVAGDETVATVEVIKGEKLAENQIPALPEGYDKWDFNADDAIVENVVVKGALKVYDVTFDFGVMYAAMNVTIQVEHGQLIPADKVPVIPEAFPEKDKRWNFDASVPVTGPMTIQLRDNIYYDVAFVAGETEVAKITVLEGTAIPAEQIPALPEGFKAWDFDFETLINENTTVEAIAEEASFNVTFQIEGKTDVTQKSDSLTVPATYREGYEFQGWVVAGTSDYVDPMEYAYTGDVTFVAIYRSIAPQAPEEPGFFETTSGQIALVVIVIVVLGAVALAVAPASPMNYKLVKGKLDAAKAAKEAKKKP